LQFCYRHSRNYTVGRATVYADRAVSLGWSL